MNRTILALWLSTVALVAGPYPGGGPYPLGPLSMPGAPGSFTIYPPQPGSGQTANAGTANGASSGLTISPLGSQGVLNNFWFLPSTFTDNHGILTNLDKINLRIYEGATNTSAMSRLVDLPIGLLFNNLVRAYITNQNYYKVRSSAFLYTIDQSTNVASGSSTLACLFRFPIYFTNGIYAELWNTYSNAPWPWGYVMATFSTNPISSPYIGYRLQSAYWTSYVTNNQTADQIINIPATQGIVVGQMRAIVNLTNASEVGQFWEAHGGLRYVTAPGITNDWNAGDDEYMAPSNGSSTGEYADWVDGCLHLLNLNTYSQYAVESYHWFVNDAFTWNNAAGLQIYKKRALVDGDFVGVMYYAPIRTTINAPFFVRNYTNTATASSTISINSVDPRGGNYLVVAIGMKNTTPRSISTVTCNGISCTNIYTTNLVNTTGAVALYGLANPQFGTVTVTFNGAAANSSVNAMIFSGVGGNGASTAIAAGSVSSIGAGLTTLSTDLVVDVIGYNSSTETASVTGTGEAIKSFAWHPAFSDSACSTMPGVAGTTTPAWSLTAADTISWAAVVLNGQ